MLSEIYFKNYKAFNSECVLKIKPITLLLGKNSSGKTSLTKLVSMLSAATTCNDGTLLMLRNDDNVRFANRYEDLFYRNLTTDMQLGVGYDDGTKIKCSYLMNNGRLYVSHYSVETPKGKEESSFFSELPSQTIKGIFYKPFIERVKLRMSSMSFGVNYIGPIRAQLAASFSYSGGTEKKSVGRDGQLALDILLDSYKNDGVVYKAVSEWMRDCLEGQELSIEPNSPTSGTYSMYVNRNGAKVNIVDVGQGMTQLLPVIVESYLPKTSEVEIIEQPALHLHPSAHANVAARLVDSALSTGKKYIIESHSKTFLLGLRKKVAAGDIPAADVMVYFVDSDDEGSYLKPIHIDREGNLDYWPTGVFEEDFELYTDIQNYAR